MIKWFKDMQEDDLSSVGGKALNLGLMFKDFPVPNGFVITADMFRKYVDSAKISQDIGNLDLDDMNSVKRFSESLRENIRKIKIDNKDRENIMRCFDELGSRFVAVRSSGTSEDLPDAAFAGQHDTYLYVVKDDVIDKILDCYSSIYSVRAIYYRSMKKIGNYVAIAVIIQEMIDADKSGIMYTKNPVSGEDEVIIEASHGVGELVVSGLIEPDNIVIKHGGVTYRKGSKKRMMSLSGTFDNQKSNEHAIDDKEIKELESIGKKLEELFLHPQDIEFAHKDKKLYIMQSRNLTTIKKS